MDPPIGFVPLRDAADAVGRKVYGSKWRPIGKIDAIIIMGAENPKIENVLKRFATWCEAGELLAAYRSLTGTEDLDPGVWQVLSWRNYFTTGTIDWLDANGHPNLNGLRAIYPREIFVRQQDLDHLTGTLSGRKTARATRGQIVEFVSNYRRSLQAGINPSIAKCEQFARDNGWSGADRNALRKEYHSLFPNQRRGRPTK
jgi:hypothetical protein